MVAFLRRMTKSSLLWVNLIWVIPVSAADSSIPFGVSDNKIERIILILMENENYNDVVRNRRFQKLMDQGTTLTNYRALSHPSYPNYIAMVAGSAFGIITDIQTTKDVTSLADLLERKGLSWKNYAEGYPGNCYNGDKKGRYVRKHTPFLTFKKIRANAARCNLIVSENQFKTDWEDRTMPNFSFYTPDMDNDGHDTDVEFSGKWLENFLNPLLADPERMAGTLIIVTYDESDALFDHNQVFTLLLGPMVKKDFRIDTKYNHYDLLRTIEDNFSLGTLGRSDRSATPITGFRN